MTRALPAIVVAAVTFAAILALSALAARSGALADDAVMLWASAIAAGDGQVSIGRIVAAYPTLPFLATALLELMAPAGAPTPALLSALLLGLVAGLWFLALRDSGIGVAAAMTATVLVALHPAILRAAVSGPSEIFLVAFLALLAKGLYDLRTTTAAPDVMTVALALVGLAFSHPMGAAIALASVPFLALAVRPSVVANSGINVVVALVFPALFCVASFVYVSWVFPGSGWSFLTSPSASLATWAADFSRRWHWPRSLAIDAGIMVALALAVGAPSAVVAIAKVHRRRPLVAPAAVLAIAAVVAATMAVVTGVFGNPASVAIAAPVLAAVAMIRIPSAHERMAPVLALLVLGWIGGAGAVLLLDPAFANQTLAMAGVAPGDRERIDALNLGHAAAGHEGVLVDTFNSPAVVLGRGAAHGLLTPQGDDFALTVLFARINAPFVAVPDPHTPAGVQDRLNKAFPKLHRFGEPGYRLVYQNSTWRMFARANALAIAND